MNKLGKEELKGIFHEMVDSYRKDLEKERDWLQSEACGYKLATVEKHLLANDKNQKESIEVENRIASLIKDSDPDPDTQEGMEDGEKIRLDIVQVKAEWVMDFIDGIDDVFKIERPYTFYVDIAAFFSPKNFVEYLNEKLKEHG